MPPKTEFLTNSVIWGRVPAAIVDSSGRVTETNEALANQLNRPSSSLVGVDPLQAMKAGAMSGDRERYIGMGMDDYISEPIDGRELATRYIRLLQNQRRDTVAA
jgi:CheY-like chemotaxis protein